jgi:hypothetical protein
MSIQAVENVLRRAREDPPFLEQLRTGPDVALHGYDLSFAERTAIITGDQDRLIQLGVDSNVSEIAPTVRPRRQEHV